MYLKTKSLIIGLVLSFFSFSGIAQYALISSEELSEIIQQENIKLIDVQKNDAFAKEHIPGAINLWRSDFTDPTPPYNGVMATKAQMEQLFSQKGISNDDLLIIYDDNGLCEAARLWWILASYDVKNIKLLNGGLSDWATKGYETTTEVATYPQTNYTLGESINTSIMASKEEVLNAIDNPNVIILDTRTLDEFEGNVQKDGAFKAGRIPSSLNNDWANCINYNGDKKIKPLAELEEKMAQMGITKDQAIITYCHSGVRSAHTTFVLTEILGFNNVKNYDGSWVEWSYFDDLPVVTGPDVMVPDTKEEVAQAEYQPGLWEMVKNSWIGFANYTWNEITFQVSPWYVNYFWWLIILSLVVWGLEIAFPWRKDQPIIRKDFWMDAFYMFFNFYIFKIVIFAAFSTGTEEIFKKAVGINLKDLALVDISTMPQWAQLLIFFVATDFIQWFTHVMLHRFDFFWKFHKVHHSVEQMGFAAHLRYHWMENVFYTPMKYIAVMLIGGFTPEQAYIVFYIAIAIGHLNHANIHLTYGPLKYIFNNPVMHLWHHVYNLPEGRNHGINFGISLSIWDYIFRTAAIPKDDAHIKLGFPGLSKFPKSFVKQLFYGFKPGDK